MKRLVLLAVAAIAASNAHADRMPIPANAPPAFKAECGSCHLPFPPALLAANDWQRVMGNLEKHYGDNASLDEKSRRAIEEFLMRNAGSGRRTEGASVGGALPRPTATTWFRREHNEIPTPAWKDKRVGSAANCLACHTRADAGSFSEREIRIPGGYRHERD
ncbi:MAG TPA: cytochrome C [Rhodocyclaceae bacterium]|nr:cytochrome C [Rhodocyclaceae bacterium]